MIDDLTDTGKTAGIVRAMMPKAHFATVYAKPKGRPLVDTFVTEVSQDTWIYFPVGYGFHLPEADRRRPPRLEQFRAPSEHKIGGHPGSSSGPRSKRAGIMDSRGPAKLENWRCSTIYSVGQPKI